LTFCASTLTLLEEGGVMRKILLGPTMAGDRRRLGSLLAGRFHGGGREQL
jgi:hypothetical protein